MCKKNKEMAKLLNRITKPEICTRCENLMELMGEEKVGEDGAVHWERKYHCDKCNRVYSEVSLEHKLSPPSEDACRETPYHIITTTVT